MNSYVLKTGVKYTLIQGTPTKTLVTPCVADRDIHFESSEFFHLDLVDKVIVFRVGNRLYYAATDSVTVIKQKTH